MFELTKLRRSRVQDMPLGNLAVCKIGDNRCLGIVVTSPHHPEQKGMLCFPPVPWEDNKTAPIFTIRTDYQLDAGFKPEFLWPSANWDALSDTTVPPPAVGHLVAVNGVVAIGGVVAGLGKYAPVPYWNVTTGAVSADPAGNDHAIYVAQWRVGWRDQKGDFHELAKFPAVP